MFLLRSCTPREQVQWRGPKTKCKPKNLSNKVKYRGGRTVMRGERRRIRRKASRRRERASLSPAGAYAANSATKRWHASRDARRGSTRGPSSASHAASASSAGPCHVCSAHHTSTHNPASCTQGAREGTPARPLEVPLIDNLMHL